MFVCQFEREGAEMAQSYRKQNVGINKENEVIRRLQIREQELLKKLRVNETLNAKILDALPFTIFLEDAEGRVIFINKHGSGRLGVTIEQMAGKTKYELFPPAIAESYRQYDQEVWRTKALVTKEELIDIQDKKTYAFTGKTIIRVDEEPLEDYLLGFSIDITSRVKAEQLLRESEERFRKLVDQAADSFFLIDMNQQIVDVNVQACKMLGYSRDDLLSVPLDRIHSSPQAERQQLMDQVISGETANFEDWLIRQDGTLVPVDIKLGLIQTDEQHMILALVRDITERKIAAERIEHMAYHDYLTGLPNRRFIMKRSEELLTASKSKQDKLTHAVMVMDLDDFKVINDSLGHQAGDRLLQLVSIRLQNCVSPNTILARLGGDEFILLVPDWGSAENVNVINESIMRSMDAPFTLDDRLVTVTTSIGISVYPNDGKDIHTLLKHADIALYQSKKQGRNGCQMFQTAMLESANLRLQTETLLRYALENNTFFVQYQPKVNLENGSVLGFEALIRCRDELGQTIAPDVFIPTAEETGLIVTIDDWILREACLACRKWNETAHETLSVSVNLSAVQFNSNDLEQRISDILQETGLLPHLLELELTERTVMHDPKEAAKTLRNLKELGICLSIDDFGMGFSSLSYLVHFPIDTLKIDRSFIRQTSSDSAYSAISIAIISLAKSLNLNVIAEGVETQEQLDFLQNHRCNAVQGYYFSRPIDQEQVIDFLHTFNFPIHRS
jgi:diguanylate cyclase (GGDEF)-like protein/PAS domain S-box-containing protein